jgi:hypothetical protein
MPTDTQTNRPASISIHFASSAASYWNRFSAVMI